MEDKLEIYKPFSPPIGKYKIPTNTVNNLNKYVENVIKNKKENRNGEINFIHGSRQFLSSSPISFKPIVGELYIFPHYLMHSVYPFYSKGERRSFSFNANINNNVYNAYEG